MQVCAYCACVTLQQNQVSQKVKCSKDIVLKLEGIISHKHFLTLFSPTTFFFLKNIYRGTLSMICSQPCWSLYFLLTNTDAHSDSGHQSFSLLWATLRAIRRFKNELAHKSLTLSYKRCQSCISCMRACVCQLHRGLTQSQCGVILYESCQ